MTCRACGHENPEGARFCGACATSLLEDVACPGCGVENPGDQKFCNACAAPLAAAVPAASPQPVPVPEHLAQRILAQRGSLVGERKHVTVLFADVMGSMDLAEAAGADRWHTIVDRFFALLCDGVHRFEGTVNKFTGDGVMALFGAPLAHEDHAQRACYAALALREELDRFAAELRREQGLNFAVRMGLNSGEVVVGEIGDDLHLDYTAIGHTVGLAQRVESVAAPDKAYLTGSTAALVSGYFALDDLGDFDLKGVSEPVRVYELQGVGAARTRLDVSRERGLTRFVGRAEEEAALDAAFATALERTGQIVGVVGEAGLGKSRLCYEFAQRCRARGIAVYEGHGVAHGAAVPLLPVLELLRDYFDIGERDEARVAREKIAGRLLLLDEGFKNALPLLFDFLGVSDPDRPAALMDPDARQRQLLGAIRGLIQTTGQRDPVVVLVEDLHWLDEASQAFIETLVEALPGSQTFLVTNFRPEYQASWMRKSYYRQLALSPLGAEALDELVADVLGPDPSLDGLAEQLRERTGGNPFFTEEAIQSLIEDGTLAGSRGTYRLVRSIEELAVPASVHAILAARIDRLGEREKTVLQTAAVIGREFPEPLLARATGMAADDLGAALSLLVGSEFLYEQALYPQAEYIFKHALTQDVAYGSLLTERTTTTHAAVADAIAELHHDSLDEHAAMIAHHLEHGGKALEAARWRRRAAEAAGTGHAGEAVAHWRKVRELAGRAPETPEAIGLSLEACIRIMSVGWRMGISEHEEAEVFAAGRQLAERTGDPVPLALLSMAYALSRAMAGEVGEALERTLEWSDLAERVEDPDLVVLLQFPSWWNWTAGDLRGALTSCEQTIERTREDHSIGISVWGFSVHAWTVMFRPGYLLPSMGRLDEARQELEPALELARAQESPEVLCWASIGHAQIERFTGEREAGLAHAREGVEIAERLGGAFSRVNAYHWLAAAHLASEAWAEAVGAGELALELGRETRTRVLEGLTLALLAEAHLGRDEQDLARQTAEEALEVCLRRGTRGYEIEARLALARALLAGENALPGDIEPQLRQALVLVQETGAISYEPLIRVELAALARLTGDHPSSERELSDAARLWREFGAPKRAAEIDEQRASAAGKLPARPDVR